MDWTDLFLARLRSDDVFPYGQMMLVFESLEMILLRTASDLSHFNMVGNTIVKKTLSSCVKLLQASFHSENHRLVGLL